MSKHIKAMISRYIDGGLKGRELSEFESHVKTCAGCGRALAETRQAIKEAKKAKDMPLPADFYAKLNKKLDAVDAVKERPALRWNVFLRNAAIVFTLLVVGVFVYNLKKQTNNFSGIASKDGSQMPQEAGLKNPAPAGNKAMGMPVEKKKKAVSTRSAPEIQDRLDLDKTAAIKEENIYTVETLKKQVYRAKKPGTAASGEAPEPPETAYEAEASANVPAAAPAGQEAPAAKADGMVMAAGKTAGSTAEQPAQTFVFRDENAWKAFADSNGIKINGQPDFTKQMIVAVFSGAKPAAGYSVTITGVRSTDGGIVVGYKESAPPAGYMNAQVITYPYTYKIIDRSDLQVEFEEEK